MANAALLPRRVISGAKSQLQLEDKIMTDWLNWLKDPFPGIKTYLAAAGLFLHAVER